jgi:hypothetical protein
MKAKKFDRERLVEIVESYGGSMRTFDGLRPDCYEQKLAAHSLEQLDLAYSEIFVPGRNSEKAARKCPKWPPESHHAGERPGWRVVERIHFRIQTERALGVLVGEDEAAAKFMQMARKYLPKEIIAAVERIVGAMSQEVMAGKLRGIPVSEQLPPVDRLLTWEKMEQRSREGKLKEKKLKLEERRTRVLEKKSEETGKKGEEGEPITKEGWEQVEKDLRLL